MFRDHSQEQDLQKVEGRLKEATKIAPAGGKILSDTARRKHGHQFLCLCSCTG